MRAFLIDQYGQPPRFADIPCPAPGPGEISVRIGACGLNFADLLMIEGRYQDRPDPPVTLGMELAGTVAALGDGVQGFAPGDRVAVYSGQGGLAEAGSFPAERCVKLPDGLPLVEAAGFLIAYGTSHLALTRRARLQAGETLLVLGAGGGVGLTAVEIGKRLGARVIACAGGAEKLAAAEKAGADHLIDSETQDIRETVIGLGRADVVYDPVGGDQYRAAFRALTPEARVLAIGFASGDIPQIPANHLMVKNVDVIGVNWGAYLRFNPPALTDSLSELLDWYAKGDLHPHVGHVLPFDQAEAGLELLRSRSATGKVVIRI